MSIVAYVNSGTGFGTATITALRVIPNVGNMTATITTTAGELCGLGFNGSGVITLDPSQVPFNAFFAINTTYNACDSTWDTYGVAALGFTLDGITMDGGATIHAIYDSANGTYNVLEVSAFGRVGGSSGHLHYNLSSGEYEIFLDVVADSFRFNTALINKNVDCEETSEIAQFTGVGMAQIDFGDHESNFFIDSNYSSCKNIIAVTGGADRFEVMRIIVNSPRFSIFNYNLPNGSYTNGTISGSAEIGMGQMFNGSTIAARAHFNSQVGLQYLQADVSVISSTWDLNFAVMYQSIPCDQIGAVWGQGSGTLNLHFSDQDWIITGGLLVFNLCNDTGHYPKTVVDGSVQFNGSSIGGFPLQGSAHVVFTTYSDHVFFFQLYAKATFANMMADLYVSAGNTNETVLSPNANETGVAFDPVLQDFIFSFNMSDPTQLFTLDATVAYHRHCDIQLQLGMVVTSKAYFTLDDFGSFQWDVVGQYFDCAQTGQIMWFLEASASYQAPLTLAGLDIVSPSITLTGTNEITMHEDEESGIPYNTSEVIWNAVVRGNIGAQFVGIADVDVYASISFGTRIGLGSLNVQVTFQNDLLLASILISYMAASNYPCSTINRGPNWSLQDFNPSSSYFQGGFGSADLYLSGILEDPIHVQAEVAYDACLDVWWLSSTYSISGVVQGLQMDADVRIIILGSKPYDSESYVWDGRLAGNAYIETLDLNATMDMVVNSEHGLDYIELTFTQPTDIGYIDLAVKYDYTAPAPGALELSGSSCKVGEAQTISGTGIFNLNLASGDTTDLCILLLFYFCFIVFDTK